MELTDYERHLLKRSFQRTGFLTNVIGQMPSDEQLDTWIDGQFELWAGTDAVDAEQIIRGAIRIAEEFEHGEG